MTWILGVAVVLILAVIILLFMICNAQIYKAPDFN